MFFKDKVRIFLDILCLGIALLFIILGKYDLVNLYLGFHDYEYFAYGIFLGVILLESFHVIRSKSKYSALNIGALSFAKDLLLLYGIVSIFGLYIEFSQHYDYIITDIFNGFSKSILFYSLLFNVICQIYEKRTNETIYDVKKNGDETLFLEKKPFLEQYGTLIVAVFSLSVMSLVLYVFQKIVLRSAFFLFLFGIASFVGSMILLGTLYLFILGTKAEVWYIAT